MSVVRLIFAAIAAAFLAGCANPQQLNNTVGGAAVGAMLGAVVGDSSEAAKRGAVIGAIAGASIPTQHRAYGGAPYPVQGQVVHPGPVYGPQAVCDNGKSVAYHPGLRREVCAYPGDRNVIFRGSHSAGVIHPGPVVVQQPHVVVVPQRVPRPFFHGNQVPIPQGAVCGPAAMHMSCPSISIPGTNCRRCQ